jgi:hypothetical protein
VTSSTTSDYTGNLLLNTVQVGNGAQAFLGLGNTTGEGESGVLIFSNGSAGVQIRMQSGITGSNTEQITLPNASGTLALTADLASLKVTRTFVNQAAVDAATPDFIGQIGVDLTDAILVRSVGTAAGDWSSAFNFSSVTVLPSGTLDLASTNSGGLISISGENATDFRTVAFPDASGTVALTTSNVASATALATSRDIFGQSFNGTGNVNGNLLTNGHLASVPSGGGAGHLVTLNGTSPTVASGRSAWWSNASGVPSFRNGTGSVSTIICSTDLGTGVETFLATPTSANLAAAVTDETGSGSLVFGTSPTITTPTISRGSTGQVFIAQDNNNATVTMTTDANGRNFFTVNGKTNGVAQSGAYITANGFEESWIYANTTNNATGNRVMRFGNLSSRFSIQRMNDANTSITATPFSLANNAPTNSFYMDASGNTGYGTSSPTAFVDINNNTLRIRTARTPASATATGNAGDICWDANYIYVCTATNTWKRTAISTW